MTELSHWPRGHLGEVVRETERPQDCCRYHEQPPSEGHKEAVTKEME